MAIYIDADACPVKEEISSVARRVGSTCMSSPIPLSARRWSPASSSVLANAGPDEADNWIKPSGRGAAMWW